MRKSRGMSQLELSEKLGYHSHGYLSELEHARKVPTVQAVIELSKIFSVTTDYLLNDELPVEGDE